jgi:primary-amine oxidase
MASTHPLAPLGPHEIQLATKIITASFPSVELRFKLIDLNEPVKKALVPYLEAERTGSQLPRSPPRILYAFFNRLDTGSFLKALVNVSDSKVLVIKELPSSIQVDISDPFYPSASAICAIIG